MDEKKKKKISDFLQKKTIIFLFKYRYFSVKTRVYKYKIAIKDK